MTNYNYMMHFDVMSDKVTKASWDLGFADNMIERDKGTITDPKEFKRRLLRAHIDLGNALAAYEELGIDESVVHT